MREGSRFGVQRERPSAKPRTTRGRLESRKLDCSNHKKNFFWVLILKALNQSTQNKGVVDQPNLRLFKALRELGPGY